MTDRCPDRVQGLRDDVGDIGQANNSPIATNWAAAARFSARHDAAIRSTRAVGTGTAAAAKLWIRT